MQRGTSLIRSKIFTAKFFTYETISLRLFIDITNTGDYRKVVKSGYGTEVQCLDAWERIIQRNNEANGNNDYHIYLSEARRYGHILAQYLIEKSMLTKLCIVSDQEKVKEEVEELRERGYRIDTTKNKLYHRSIEKALKRCNNLMVKANITRGEMMKKATRPGDDMEQSFEELVAAISFMMGFTVSDDITLARFNEYKKLIKKKIDHGRIRKT